MIKIVINKKLVGRIQSGYKMIGDNIVYNYIDEFYLTGVIFKHTFFGHMRRVGGLLYDWKERQKNNDDKEMKAEVV